MAVMVTRAVARHPTLRWCHLVANHLGDSTARAFAEALQTNTELRWLHLSSRQGLPGSKPCWHMTLTILQKKRLAQCTTTPFLAVPCAFLLSRNAIARAPAATVLPECVPYRFALQRVGQFLYVSHQVQRFELSMPNHNFLLRE